MGQDSTSIDAVAIVHVRKVRKATMKTLSARFWIISQKSAFYYLTLCVRLGPPWGRCMHDMHTKGMVVGNSEASPTRPSSGGALTRVRADCSGNGW